MREQLFQGAAVALLWISGGLILNPTCSGEDKSCTPFQDGDTVCFVGDSITHTGGYINVLRDFYHLNFPERRISMVNCGISGDSLNGVLGRLDEDVLVHKPSVIYVMLGMNDVGRDRFGPGKPSAAATDGAVQAYAGNLRKLAARVKQSGAREIVMMSPTLYDEYVVGPKFTPPLTGCDAGLALLAEQGRICAAENGWGFVDQHKAMYEWSARLRKTNPEFTFLNTDRVHPMLAGHYLIAGEILKAQGVWGQNARLAVGVQAAAGETQGFTLRKSAMTPAGGEFEAQSAALPLVISPGVEAVPELYSWYQTAAPRILCVGGLAKGRYSLCADGTALGAFTDGELAAGISLNTLENSMEFLQAVQVFSLDAQLTGFESMAVRDPRAARFFLQGARRGNPKLPQDDLEAAKQILDGGANGYIPGLYRKLLEFGSPEQKISVQAKLKSMRDEIYAANQPRPVVYSLKAVSMPEQQAAVPEGKSSELAEIPAKVAVMICSLPNERLKHCVNGNTLLVSGVDNQKKILLKWELPAGIPSGKISSVELIVPQLYAQKLETVNMGRVDGNWTAEAVNYYYQPRCASEVLPAAEIKDGKWIFQGPGLTALVREWASHPDANKGVWLSTPQMQAFGAFSMEKPPVLRIKYGEAGN
ncbi:MAG: GDSL-type esterase/lipase family protein [Victivallales bacterium]